MKHLIIFLFSVATVFSQDILIRVSNNYPEIGEEVEISFNFLFLDDMLQNSLGNDFELDETWINRKKDFNSDLPFNFNSFEKRSFTAKQAGDYQIGPYNFTVNGKTYTSDSVTLHVGKTKITENELKVYFNKYNNGTARIIFRFKGKINESSGEYVDDWFPSLSENDDLYKINNYRYLITSTTVFLKKNNIIEREYYVENISDKTIFLTKDFFRNIPDEFELPKMEIPASKKNM